MKITISSLLLIALVACNTKPGTEATKKNSLSLAGTWKLISGTLIEKSDTAITDYTKNLSFIKILNDTHFAFLEHNLKGSDSAIFVSGGGRYSLTDSNYTEHLEYCSDRQWEGTDFKFTVTIKDDTLTQQGVEKVESAGINRINIEKYVREKN